MTTVDTDPSNARLGTWCPALMLCMSICERGYIVLMFVVLYLSLYVCYRVLGDISFLNESALRLTQRMIA